MGKLLLNYLFIGVVVLQGAVIQGTVMDNQTGHALARATVVLDPVAGTGGAGRQSVRTDSLGIFQFGAVAAGSYYVSASRIGFATTQYGQKNWKAAGIPITVGANDSFTVALRLPHYGVVSGYVLDENDVGLPNLGVVAYRNSHTPTPVALGVSDDWGFFRVTGLPAGNYVIRSVAKEYENQGYVPTFAREGQNLDQSLPVRVEMDQQFARSDVRPNRGRLFPLTIGVAAEPARSPIALTLVSELGREAIYGSSHTFGPLAPGKYQIFAQVLRDNGSSLEEYQEISITGTRSLNLVAHETADTQFTFSRSPANVSTVHLLARRNDLDGPGPNQKLSLDASGRVHLSRGPWQIAVEPNAEFYVSGFSGPPSMQIDNSHPEGWNDVVIGSSSTIEIILAPNPGVALGTVQSSGHSVIGAPVFLEPIDISPARRISETDVTRTDVNGQYKFVGLAPGKYRLVATFDYASLDAESMATLPAKTISVADGVDLQQDLDLYIGP